MELDKIIEKLIKLKGSIGGSDQVYLGGSFALKNVYQILKRDTKDIDIIIYNFNQKQLDWIEEHFELDYKSEGYNTTVHMNKDKNIFYIQALHNRKPVIINFIVYKDFRSLDSYARYQNFIDVVPLKAILDAKLEYNRPKDKSDILDIIMELNKPGGSHLPYKKNSLLSGL